MTFTNPTTNADRTTEGGPTPTSRYTVTYAFEEPGFGDAEGVIETIAETAARMRRDGVDVEFLGVVRIRASAGGPLEFVVTYAAPNEGAVGQLNWRAGLPASGPPRRRRPDRASRRSRDAAKSQ